MKMTTNHEFVKEMIMNMKLKTCLAVLQLLTISVRIITLDAVCIICT